jgi:hypothetical protein
MYSKPKVSLTSIRSGQEFKVFHLIVIRKKMVGIAHRLWSVKWDNSSRTDVLYCKRCTNSEQEEKNST